MADRKDGTKGELSENQLEPLSMAGVEIKRALHAFMHVDPEKVKERLKKTGGQDTDE